MAVILHLEETAVTMFEQVASLHRKVQFQEETSNSSSVGQ
jgi:hypothetical protein